jgi:hypothetical protein
VIDHRGRDLVAGCAEADRGAAAGVGHGGVGAVDLLGDARPPQPHQIVGVAVAVVGQLVPGAGQLDQEALALGVLLEVAPHHEPGGRHAVAGEQLGQAGEAAAQDSVAGFGRGRSR